ncbi:MAG: cytochrome c peroxidase [Gammaproteobacteria bacterium]|nr:MAG: cytochrome c peroxidase [Gammaproteobacteria bacterium]TND06241.1 MAG: cytochrome c peroxidase [Gammaproteobacteria bacterium]
MNAMKRTAIIAIGAMAWLPALASAMEALPALPPIPSDNPMSAAKVELGKQLFFDPRLSIDGTVSCNSCHNVMASGTDNRSVSVGVSGLKGGRSAPTVWNAAFLTAQFWDGRAATLEDQAKGPILNPIEMGMPNAQAVLDRLNRIPGYRDQFVAVFGGNTPLTFDNVAKAIAAYERTLVTPNSPFDRYLRGEEGGLSEKAKLGMQLVQDVGCTGCHNGPNFAGPASMPMGMSFFQKFPVFPGSTYDSQYRLTQDLGRYEVTKQDEDKNMWRVPTWRNIALTAPYFHNGSVATLDEAVRVMAKTQVNIDLNGGQVDAIVAFLNSLTGELPLQMFPLLPSTPNGVVVPVER